MVWLGDWKKKTRIHLQAYSFRTKVPTNASKILDDIACVILIQKSINLKDYLICFSFHAFRKNSVTLFTSNMLILSDEYLWVSINIIHSTKKPELKLFNKLINNHNNNWQLNIIISSVSKIILGTIASKCLYFEQKYIYRQYAFIQFLLHWIYLNIFRYQTW